MRGKPVTESRWINWDREERRINGLDEIERGVAGIAANAARLDRDFVWSRRINEFFERNLLFFQGARAFASDFRQIGPRLCPGLVEGCVNANHIKFFAFLQRREAQRPEQGRPSVFGVVGQKNNPSEFLRFALRFGETG